MAENTKPTITAAQRKAVWDEFKKMGYNPSTEGEVDYWAAKPIGELFSALQKRKDAEPKKQLTNAEIKALYDEAGLAPRLKSQADYDWARSHFPNDAEGVRKALKAEVAANQKAQQGGAPLGMTQNNITTGNTGNVSSNNTGTTGAGPTGQFNSPTGHLVKFKSDPNGAEAGDASTLWFLDTEKKALRPIMSMKAFNDSFNNDPALIAQAKKSINTLDVKDIQPGGAHSDYFLLGTDYGVYDGGVAKELDFTPAQIAQRYGQSSSSAQLKAAASLDKILNLWKYTDSGLSKDQIEKIQNDPTTIGGLVGAMAYGGYSLSDVWQEMKRKVAADAGDANAKSTKVIDGSQNRDTYGKTNASKQAASLFPLPATIADMDSNLLKQPLTQMPDSFFTTLFSGANWDPTNPDYIAKVNAVKSSGHDLVLDQLHAQTVEAKAAADQAFEKWRTETEKTLGISLSKDAMQAWNQLEGILSKNSDAGLSGSGIENEQTDDALKAIRQTDQWNREITKTAIDNKTEETLKASASPDQIKKMNEEDAAAGLPRAEWRSVKMGLSPAEEMTSAKFLADWRSKYPNDKRADADILDREYSQYYDENGNNRSDLYQASEDNRQKTVYGNTVGGEVAGTSKKAFQTDIAGAQLKTDLENAEGANGPSKGDFSGGTFDQNSTEPVVNQTVKQTLGTDPASIAAKLKARQIANVAQMKTYDPSQYEKIGTGVYFKDGITAATAKKATPATPASTLPKGVPTGYQAIAAPSAIKNYQPNSTITVGKTLYGKPTTPPVVQKPTTPTGNTTSQSTTGTQKAPASTFAVKPGTSYIPNVASIKNYSNTYTDPATKKMYGTLKK